jgi:hypothetical protein
LTTSYLKDLILLIAIEFRMGGFEMEREKQKTRYKKFQLKQPEDVSRGL